jgi:hypothetical protein
MARRTGLATLRALAYRGCRLIATFTPILSTVYAGNAPLLAALSALNAACGVFVEIADETIVTGA